MALTFKTLLPSAGANTACQTFSVPANYLPAGYANGALHLVSSTGASAETVFAVDITAVASSNAALATQAIPSGATTLLFSDNGWIVVK